MAKEGTTDQSEVTESADDEFDAVEVRLASSLRGVVWTLTLALCAYIAFAVYHKAEHGLDLDSGSSELVTIVLTIFAVLITGVFIFTTFRIDRGARFEASAVATKVAADIATSHAKETAERVAEEAAIDAATKQASKTAGRIARQYATKTAKDVAAATAAEHAKVQAELTAKEVSEKMLEDMETRIAQGITSGVAKALANRGTGGE